MKYHRSNITCSARLRQKLYDSDAIQFFHFYDICEGSLKFSEVQVWGRRVKALRITGSKDAARIVNYILEFVPPGGDSSVFYWRCKILFKTNFYQSPARFFNGL